jgi:hypothetical protein
MEKTSKIIKIDNIGFKTYSSYEIDEYNENNKDNNVQLECGLDL